MEASVKLSAVDTKTYSKLYDSVTGASLQSPLDAIITLYYANWQQTNTAHTTNTTTQKIYRNTKLKTG